MKTFQKYSPIITVVILIAVWYIAAIIQNSRLILPTPLDTLKEMFNVFADGRFYRSLAGSLVRTVVSFSIAFVLAIILALLANASKVFERLFYPIIVIVRATPTMSVIFLCIISFSSKVTPMIVATAVIFPTMYSSVLTAIKSCDKSLIEMSDVYKVPTIMRIRKLYLPYVSDKVFSDAVSAISLNVKLIVAAEAIAQTSQSIGVLMQIAKLNLETASLFAYTVAAVVLSVILETVLKLIRKIVRRLSRAKA